MGEDNVTNRAFSTKYSVQFNIELDQYILYLTPDEIEYESKGIAWTSNTIDAVTSIKNEFDPSWKKVMIASHVYGASIFRTYFFDYVSDWGEAYKRIKNLFDLCDNGQEISSRFADRRMMGNYKEIAPTHMSYDTSKRVYTKVSVYTEIQDDYIDNFNLGSWLHRYVVILGLQTSNSISDTDMENLRELASKYEYVMDKVIEKQNKLFRDMLNNMIVNEWGLVGIPSSASDDVAYLIYHLPNLSDDFVKKVMEMNRQVYESYKRIKNEQER